MANVLQKSVEGSGLTKPFRFEFVDENRSCRLEANVAIPADLWKVSELTKRIMNYHSLPVYLEEDLLNALQVFITKENEAYYNDMADSVLDAFLENPQLSETVLDSWNEAFTQECSRYSDAKEVKTEELTFSEMYHSLIHSPALETLLQLENTYALAVQDMLVQRDAALNKLEQKDDVPDTYTDS